MKSKLLVIILVALLALAATVPVSAMQDTRQVRVNVLLNRDVTDGILADLGRFGRVREVLAEIRAVTLTVRLGSLSVIRALPYVASANPDAERYGAPIGTVPVDNFAGGINTWNLDAINVTDFGTTRTTVYDGTGVYVAVLDTGLVDTWRQFFPEERIAVQYARSFGGGGNERGFVSEQPNKWEHDQDSHGTHVTSTIIGYKMRDEQVNGVAPMATIIPVKVLNNNGSGWSSVVAAGIAYVAGLKEGPLKDSPVIINMSLGGPVLDGVEAAAIDYAIRAGVIVVASAGNSGSAGMGYPGAYQPVISVAAAGWTGEWIPNRSWWRTGNVTDPTNPGDFYITDFSSRELHGQELDVAAPGSWVVGPYKLNSGNRPSFYFLGGTSMASPHVAGIAALMAQKCTSLGQEDAERILKNTALGLPPGSRSVLTPWGTFEMAWGSDATGAGLVQADAALAAVP